MALILFIKYNNFMTISVTEKIMIKINKTYHDTSIVGDWALKGYFSKETLFLETRITTDSSL